MLESNRFQTTPLIVKSAKKSTIKFFDYNTLNCQIGKNKHHQNYSLQFLFVSKILEITRKSKHNCYCRRGGASGQNLPKLPGSKHQQLKLKSFPESKMVEKNLKVIVQRFCEKICENFIFFQTIWSIGNFLMKKRYFFARNWSWRFWIATWSPTKLLRGGFEQTEQAFKVAHKNEKSKISKFRP